MSRYTLYRIIYKMQKTKSVYCNMVVICVCLFNLLDNLHYPVEHYISGLCDDTLLCVFLIYDVDHVDIMKC